MKSALVILLLLIFSSSCLESKSKPEKTDEDQRIEQLKNEADKVEEELNIVRKERNRLEAIDTKGVDEIELRTHQELLYKTMKQEEELRAKLMEKKMKQKKAELEKRLK